MKKIKFLGAAVLAASLIFAGCSSPAGAVPEGVDPIDNNNQTGENNNGQNNNGENNNGENNNGENNNGQNNNNNQNTNNGGNEDKPHNYTAPAITDYYKNYLVSSPAAASNKTIADWGAGSAASYNDDGTWSISASDGMWWDGKVETPKVPGVCAPFTGIDAGLLANYEYIVFTVDTTDFVIDTSDTTGNHGVNVKVPDVQKNISGNYVENGKLRTYYAPMSLFETAPAAATEFAIIIGGTGTIKLNEVYLAAVEDPSTKVVTGITISPASANLQQNGTLQFTVKDSNLVNRTSDVIYSLSGEAEEGSTITPAGLLTVGTTAGSLTVTASYTVAEKTFTSSATVTVMGAMTNLVKSVDFTKFLKANGGNVTELGDVVSLENNVVTVHKPEDSAWGEWSCQLFLNVTADEGKNIFEAGKKYYLSVTVESTADLNNCVWKEDTKATFTQHPLSYVANEPKTLTQEIEPVEDMDAFNCLLSFPGAESVITVSNIIVYDITPVEK